MKKIKAYIKHNMKNARQKTERTQSTLNTIKVLNTF